MADPKRDKRPLRAEHAFFAAWVLWLAAVLFWHPEPVVTFADAPSARKAQDGFSLFYELVATQTKGARRVLSAPDDFPKDVGVLVLLSPREAIPSGDIDDLLSWVEQGGTLILGYPLSVRSGGDVEVAQAGLLGCGLLELGEAQLSTLSYTGSSDEMSRKVPPFQYPVETLLNLESCEGVMLLGDETNEAVAAFESRGNGTVIEIADAELLSNAGIGWKSTHLWAAALMDEGGREKVWAFDESYHGIKPEPQIVRLLGAGNLRLVFLHVVLLLLVGYWWRSRGLGPALPREKRVPAREVATLIDDLGAFYLRAGKSLWALDRSVEHLRSRLKERGTSSQARAAAEEALAQARQALRSGNNDMTAHLPLLVDLARAEHALGRSAVARSLNGG
jgi:hypothetical protein